MQYVKKCLRLNLCESVGFSLICIKSVHVAIDYLMTHHPLLKILYALYQSEIQPFRKVHRLIDLF